MVIVSLAEDSSTWLLLLFRRGSSVSDEGIGYFSATGCSFFPFMIMLPVDICTMLLFVGKRAIFALLLHPKTFLATPVWFMRAAWGWSSLTTIR